jgi:beta-lactam-binding protein with PASTA domain
LLIVVALVSAFIAMRLAIHGREAVVPPVTGLAVADAAGSVSRQGLQLSIENRFYSSEVPAGHVIAQDPPAGFRVRRDWPVRITESLGSQRVAVPNLVGQSERAAMITIRQLGLEPGTIVHMVAPGDADVVLAQTPAPDAGEMASPHISLLVSDPESQDPPAFAMPSLAGLTYAAAELRVQGAGLRLVPEQDAPPESDAGNQKTAPQIDPSPGVSSVGTIVAQSIAPGRRVLQGSVVHVTVGASVP